jgi:hypothetical protein
MATPPGYNITCDPGDLYNRRCYVNTASGAKQEIIGYTSDGQPISKAQSSASWIAWVPTLTTLNQDGQAYQPYGEAGLPYVAPGAAGSGTQDVSGSAFVNGGPSSSSSSSSSQTKGRSQGLESMQYAKVLGTVVATVGVSAMAGAFIMKKWG